MVVRKFKKRATVRSQKRSFYRPIIKKLILGLLVLIMISQQQDYTSTLNRDLFVESKSYLLQKAAANRLLQQMSSMSLSEQEHKTIRSWGCNLTESPLVFVHIGKSGGGTIRARFAAAALNFTREKWWNYHGDNHYYPMPTRRRLNEETTTTSQEDSNKFFSRGTFCSSNNNNRRRIFGKNNSEPLKRFSQQAFEQVFECNAQTPLGRFVGCPAVFRKDQACKGCSNLSDAGCYAVYAGHNPLGNELHWLSAPLLQDWWNEKWASLFPSKTMSSVQSITPGTSNPYWCPQINETRSTEAGVTMTRRAVHKQYYDCSKNISLEMDETFLPSWHQIASKFGMEKNYAPFYASLPMHRTVLLREPFSWLMSRFFWALEYRSKFKCDDIPTVTKYGTNLTFAQSGWAYQVVLEALFSLCGEDCINRYETNEIDLMEIEQQAESNLRHSFSVVGLLNETDSFYDMVSARIQYSNMSNNPHIYGPTHATVKTVEQRRCTHKFQKNKTIRASLRAALPHFAALERLYHVGVEVNRFQTRELSQCMNPIVIDEE